jgi:hypothetical protein
MEICLSSVNAWFKEHGLIINVDKTKFVVFHKSNDNISSINIDINCDGFEIERVYTFKYLGVILDCNLNFKSHFQYVNRRISSALGMVNRLKRFFTFKIYCIMLKSFVLSIADYCICIWGIQTEKELQTIQGKVNHSIFNAFGPKKWLQRIYRGKPKLFENELLDMANILSIKEKISYFTSLFVFESLMFDKGVECVKNVFVLNLTNETSRQTRSSQRNVLSSNFSSRHKTFECSLKFRGIREWNGLPPEVADLNCSRKTFQDKLCNFIVCKRQNLPTNVYNPP